MLQSYKTLIYIKLYLKFFIKDYLRFFNQYFTGKKIIKFIKSIKDFDYEDYLFLDELSDKCNSYKEFYEEFKKNEDIESAQMSDVYTPKLFLISLRLKRDVDLYLKIAYLIKKFKLHQKEPMLFANLVSCREIEEYSKLELVYFYKKLYDIGIVVSFEKIVEYYNSNPKESHNLKKLFLSLIFAAKKLNNFYKTISIDDLIEISSKKIDPIEFLKLLYKIFANKIVLDISLSDLFECEFEKLKKVVNLMLIANKKNISCDLFEIIYDIGCDLAIEILTLILNLDKLGVKIEFNAAKEFCSYGLDKLKILRAYAAERKNKFFENDGDLIENINKIHFLGIDKKIDPYNYYNSLILMKKLYPDESNKDILFMVNADYITGYNVWNILNVINILKKYKVNIDYNLLKTIEGSLKENQSLKDIALRAIEPIIIESQPIRITTKDNVEIELIFNIEIVLNIDNYFTGYDKTLLLDIAKIILIEEIQKNYYKEITINNEKIAHKVLYRLLSETRMYDKDYINYFELEQQKDAKTTPRKGEIKIIENSKYIPRKIIISKIEFIKETFSLANEK